MRAERILSAVLPLVAGLAVINGCGTPANNPPVIESISALPSDSAQVGGSPITLEVVATDEDDDVLSFAWRVSSGALSRTSGDSVTWVATEVGVCTVRVVCSDDPGDADTLSCLLWGFPVWQFDSVQGETPEATFLPAAVTTLIPFALRKPVPEFAQLDSAFVTVDLEPDTIGEFFTVWVTTPGGSEILVYDGVNGEPDVEEYALLGIRGENAKGDWWLKVVRDNSNILRTAGPCRIDIHYRY